MKQDVAKMMASIPMRAGGVQARLSEKANRLLQAAQRASTPAEAFDIMRTFSAQIQGRATFEAFESRYHMPEFDMTATGMKKAG